MARSAVAAIVAGAVLFAPALTPAPALASAQTSTDSHSAASLTSLAARIVELTEPYAAPTPPGLPGPGATLSDVRSAAEVSRQVTALLSSAGDMRGSFGIGLDVVEEQAVLPFEENSSQWAQALSANLIYRYLSALHAEFSGGEVPEHWARYFELARANNTSADASADRVAMAGYNAHLSVDLALAVADAGSTPENYEEFLRIVGVIGDTADEIVSRTKAAYRIDLAPLWEAAAVPVEPVGPQARDTAVRIGDQAFSSIAFANGLGLAKPETRAASWASVRSLWGSVDAVISA